MASPTQRTLGWLREQGYLAEVVERHNHFSGKKHDLYGCIDILAIRGAETLGVQATSASNVGARVAKINALEVAQAWVAGGRKLQVVGWRRYKKAENGRWWRPYVVEIEIERGRDETPR